MDWAPASHHRGARLLRVFGCCTTAICRIFGQRKKTAMPSSAPGLRAGVASWLACHWFAGRAAFCWWAAMIATAMSANVFF